MDIDHEDDSDDDDDDDGGGSGDDDDDGDDDSSDDSNSSGGGGGDNNSNHSDGDGDGDGDGFDDDDDDDSDGDNSDGDDVDDISLIEISSIRSTWITVSWSPLLVPRRGRLSPSSSSRLAHLARINTHVYLKNVRMLDVSPGRVLGPRTSNPVARERRVTGSVRSRLDEGYPGRHFRLFPTDEEERAAMTIVRSTNRVSLTEREKERER